MRTRAKPFNAGRQDVLPFTPRDQVKRLQCIRLIAERIRKSEDRHGHSEASESVRTRIKDHLKAKKLTGLNPVTDCFAWLHFAMWAVKQRNWQEHLGDFHAAIDHWTARAQVNVVLGEVVLNATADGSESSAIELRQRLKASELRRSELERDNSELRAEVALLRKQLEAAEPAIRAHLKRKQVGHDSGKRGGRGHRL